MWLLSLKPVEFWQWHSTKSKEDVVMSFSATLEQLREVLDSNTEWLRTRNADGASIPGPGEPPAEAPSREVYERASSRGGKSNG
jgi:hypothetical protein